MNPQKQTLNKIEKERYRKEIIKQERARIEKVIDEEIKWWEKYNTYGVKRLKELKSKLIGK